ncbi:MAG: iron uptake system protein EfeO [Paracoccus sp. (in: a-proteobacteria)]|uniref:iron uptake system protein EfeO n=1 Tax=Paracoccus sp. TaxID=267 RepID=UPI0026E0E0B2|nr:iron uptake system protein EfeO [Paracoccus sp. (in: a-proteobacteria)]MDO5614486.1 iron uptake system protein EfeO [Paracoccus sp. (in: a-proteobacteria)]
MTEPRPPSVSRLMPLAVGGAGLLAVAGAALFYYASQTATGPERGDIHKVTVGQGICDPMDFTLPAGRATFEIHNASDRPIEWEILDGVMVVEERENIAPGFHSLLTARLKPGEYQITCGLLSNPRGRLTVTPSAESEAARTAPPVTAFIGPLSEIKLYLAAQSGDLVAGVGALRDAIAAGDLVAARAAWQQARLPYKRIEPWAGRFADLKNSIDPLPDYLAAREADPDFTGFHRIEYGLWDQGSTDGLLPVADRLLADVTALQDRLRGLRLSPEDLAGSAARQADHLAQGQITAGEDRWAGTDLAGFSANLDGITRGVTLVLPLVTDASPEVAAQYETAQAATRAALDALQTPQGFAPYADVTPDQRTALADAFGQLAAASAALNPAIGLE